MKVFTYLTLLAALLSAAYFVFRVLVRREYAGRGRLTPLVSGAQLLVFLGFFSFPYQFNPPAWALPWVRSPAQPHWLFILGLLSICLGVILAIGTMAWFGFGIAFGVQTDGLRTAGPYRISRNPQVLAGWLMVIGPALQRPSFYFLGWLCAYAVIMHWMVLSEEEHLGRVFGEAYTEYCREVPRYLRLGRRVDLRKE